MKDIIIAVFVILAHIFPIFSSLADQKGNDPFNGGVLSLQMEGNEFPNDESPICCNISFKKGKTVTRWDAIIDLGIAYTGIDYGLGFEVICDKDGLPLKQKRDDIPREQIKRNSINSVIWNLRILYDLDVAGKYKVRAFYKIDEVLGTIDGPPSPGRTVKVLSHEENIYSIKSDWATFEIVDNSKERDAKIKEYRDAFSSGDKKMILGSLSALEKESIFNAVRILYNETATLADNKDKEIAEKAAEILIRVLKDESPYDQYFFGKFEKDKELLGRIVTNASSSESDELRLLAAKAMYPNAPLPKSFFKKQIQVKWFKREKNVVVRRAIVKNIRLGKKGLEDAIRTDPDVEVKVNVLHGFPMHTIADCEHILSLAKELENDNTPVVYDGKEITVGKVMSNEIKWLQETIDDYKSAEVPEKH